MNSNLNSKNYNFDYSDDVIQLNNNSRNINKRISYRNIHSANLTRNNSYTYKKINNINLINSNAVKIQSNNTKNNNSNNNNSNNNNIINDKDFNTYTDVNQNLKVNMMNTIQNNNNINNNSNSITNSSNINNNNNSSKYRINSLEERILSLEKMLQYIDEFIHLKEEEKSNNNQNNAFVEPLIAKINSLEKEIKSMKMEKENNIKIINELNNRIKLLEKKANNDIEYQANDMKKIIHSLSDKEKKLNILINQFSDMAKQNSLMINKTIKEKFNKFSINNENRINEFLVLVQTMNKITEENEIKINKINEFMEKSQKNNIDLIKTVSIQEQKFNNFDLIISEIKNIKEKFYMLMNDYNNKMINNNNFKI